MSRRAHRVSEVDMAHVYPDKPAVNAGLGSVGQRAPATPEQQFDAVRAVTHRQHAEGWPLKQTREVLDVLGLLPPQAKKPTGPRSVVCPTCSATMGEPCTSIEGRTVSKRIHPARTKAAREAA